MYVLFWLNNLLYGRHRLRWGCNFMFCFDWIICFMDDIGWDEVVILCFVDRASLYSLVNKANLVHNFSYYVYFFSLHVSGEYVPIIRRNNYIYATLGTYHSVFRIPPCIPHSHPYRVISAKWCIGTVVSPDDGHIVARNTSRKEMNVLRKLVHQVGFIHKIYKMGLCC